MKIIKKFSFIERYYRFIFNIKYRNEFFEYKKLRKTPRYIEGYSNVLGGKIKFVDSVTLLNGIEEIFNRNNYKFVPKNNNPLIIDCGANIGIGIIYFKKLFPDSRIIAFEADPKICAVLQENVNSFKLNKVDVINKAIWVDNSGIEFMVEGGFSGRIKKTSDSANLIKVKTARLKDLLFEHIDFLKIDIEGAETMVIKDCEDALSNVENLFIEYHSHFSEQQSLPDILNILKNAGFRYQIKSAFASELPFVDRKLLVGMDYQAEIFAYRS